jgi:hypothetical protein
MLYYGKAMEQWHVFTDMDGSTKYLGAYDDLHDAQEIDRVYDELVQDPEDQRKLTSTECVAPKESTSYQLTDQVWNSFIARATWIRIMSPYAGKSSRRTTPIYSSNFRTVASKYR